MKILKQTTGEKVEQADVAHQQISVLHSMFRNKTLMEEERTLRGFLLFIRWLTSIITSLPAAAWIFILIAGLFASNDSMIAIVAGVTAGLITAALLEFAKHLFGEKYFVSKNARSRVNRSAAVAYYFIITFSMLTTIPGVMYITDSNFNTEAELKQDPKYVSLEKREKELETQIVSLTKQAEGIDGKYIANNRTRDGILQEIDELSDELKTVRAGMIPFQDKMIAVEWTWILYAAVAFFLLELIHVLSFGSYVRRRWLAYLEICEITGIDQNSGGDYVQKNAAAIYQRSKEKAKNLAAPQAQEITQEEPAHEEDVTQDSQDIAQEAQEAQEDNGKADDYNIKSYMQAKHDTKRMKRPQVGSSIFEFLRNRQKEVSEQTHQQPTPPPSAQEKRVLREQEKRIYDVSGTQKKKSAGDHKKNTSKKIVFDPKNDEYITVKRARSRLRAARYDAKRWLQNKSEAKNDRRKAYCDDKIQYYNDRVSELDNQIQKVNAD